MEKKHCLHCFNFFQTIWTLLLNCMYVNLVWSGPSTYPPSTGNKYFQYWGAGCCQVSQWASRCVLGYAAAWKGQLRIVLSFPFANLTTLIKHFSEISFDIVAIAEFVQLMPERSVRRLVAFVGKHTGEHSINETATEKNLTAIREHLADNFYILGCAIHCGHPEAETVKPITLRNRFLKNQQRFKKIKAIQ